MNKPVWMFNIFKIMEKKQEWSPKVRKSNESYNTFLKNSDFSQIGRIIRGPGHITVDQIWVGKSIIQVK